MTILQSLAQRGAHVIALTEEQVESPKVAILIDLLRSTTSNEQIYAEECDLSSPTSIRYFCTKFLTGKEQRLDAIIFAHEHKHLGSPSLLSTTTTSEDQRTRDSNSLATFLITTLLLPSLLVAPVERDIRIIHVVNPFYAAAVGVPFSPSFAYESDPSKANSLFLASPGISRVDTISSLFNADWSAPSGSSYIGIALCVLTSSYATPVSYTASQILLATTYLMDIYKTPHFSATNNPSCSLPTNSFQNRITSYRPVFKKRCRY